MRKSNFELMRVVSMFLVVLYHVIGHGGLLEPSRYGNPIIFAFFKLVFLLIIVHINSFVLLSGYFQWNKEFKIGKLLSLIDSTIFYRVMILISFTVIGITQITAVNVLRAIFPFPVTEYWFIQCFLFLYLLTPFLNILLKNIDKKTFSKLLIVLLILFSIIPIISNQQIFKNDGYTVYNFVFLYLIGAYLNKYSIKKSFLFNNYSKKTYRIILVTIIILSVLFNYFVTKASGYLINVSPLFNELFSGIFNSQYFYNNPCIIIQSIAYFLLFESLTLKSKIINTVAKCTFGIYLLHDHRLVREHLYSFLKIKSTNIIYGYRFVLYVFLCAIIIFITCLIIEYIRQTILKFIDNRKTTHKLKAKTSELFSNIKPKKKLIIESS